MPSQPILSHALVATSVLFGLICIRYIRSFDLYEKEPFLTMFAATCWGGIWSIGLAILFYRSIHHFGLARLENAFGALVVIGPVEELAKFLALITCWWFVRGKLNEPVDGMNYMACVALGFSLIENYFYALNGENHSQVMVGRMIICTPMHICFSTPMGLAWYLFLQNKRNSFTMLSTFLYASISHGLFDLVQFNRLPFLTVILIVTICHSVLLSLLRYANERSPFRKSLEAYVTSYENPIMEPGIECLKCGDTGPKLTFRIGKERIQECGNCKNFVATKCGLLKIFHHFAGIFGKFPDKYYWTPLITEQKYSTLYEGNWLSEEKKIGYFCLHTLSDAIEKMNAENISTMNHEWWFPISRANEERSESNGSGATEGNGIETNEKHSESVGTTVNHTQIKLIPMMDPGEKYSACREGLTKVFCIKNTQGVETKEQRIEEKAGPKTYFDGSQVYTYTTTDLGMGYITRKDFFQGSDQGLRVVASQGFLDSTPKKIEQDLWILKYPLAVGTRWTKQEPLKFLKERVSVSLTCVIEEMNEVVSINAGIFENCMRVKEFFDGKANFGPYWGESDVKMESYLWYAPNVGRIKTLYLVNCINAELGGGEMKMELMSYQN